METTQKKDGVKESGITRMSDFLSLRDASDKIPNFEVITDKAMTIYLPNGDTIWIHGNNFTYYDIQDNANITMMMNRKLHRTHYQKDKQKNSRYQTGNY